MPREAEAGWWSDPELERLRERIEGRRAVQSAEAIAPRRGVREVRGNARLTLVRREDPAAAAAANRRRPRPRPVQRIGPRPDRIAALAVVLGLLLLFAALISSHG